jgi:hypothetical protein
MAIPLVGGPHATEDEARIKHYLLKCVHRVCNQLRGTVHGLLSDGTDQVARFSSRMSGHMPGWRP